jgi:hypothetical protein
MRLTEGEAEELPKAEEDLLRPEVRRSPSGLGALIDDGFVEFGVSGRPLADRLPPGDSGSPAVQVGATMKGASGVGPARLPASGMI